jgi:hypothetical protein
MAVTKWCWGVAVAMLAGSGPAWADGELARRITAQDQARLAQYDELRAEALARARAPGTGREGAEFVRLMSGSLRPVRGGAVDLRGDWQCRIARVGRTTPPVVHTWFRCRVQDDGSGWRLEKLDGTERTSGRFYDWSDTRMVYLGTAGSPRDEPPRYGADADRDQVAYAVRPGADRLRLEFPAPRPDGGLDVLDLRRTPRASDRPADDGAKATPRR